MGEGEDAQAEVDKDAGLADKSHGAHGLLHRDLGRAEDGSQ